MKTNSEKQDAYDAKPGDVVTVGRTHPGNGYSVEVWRNREVIMALDYREEEYFAVGCVAWSLRQRIVEASTAQPA